MNVQVTFERLDRNNIKFHSVAEKMAKFIYIHPEYLFHLSYVIRNSENWTSTDCEKNLSKYISPLRPMKTFNRDEAADRNYTDLLTRAYSLCKKDDAISDLRGILAERVFAVACMGHSNRNWKFEVGCSVKIANREVVYFDDESKESKKTVDLGGWNFSAQSGIFSEVKVSPNVFSSKDGAYLQNLTNELKKYCSIKYKIYIFSLKQKNLMAEKIKSIGYPIESSTFILDPDGLFKEDFLAF